MPLNSNLLAAITGGSFLGARVRGFQTSMGWNMGSPSQLTVQLVNDLQFGLVFTPPPEGTPVFFTFYGLTFNGLFQKWEESRDQSGDPVFEVAVVDPREILDGAQVIIGGYTGSVGGVPNLFNAYGFWENIAFDSSLVNEGGMPWYLVETAVLSMCNQPVYGAFGGPLTYRGVAYSLDLSELPTPPAFYRLGGTSVSLLEAIAQICEDGACDFFIELVGFTIRVRTVSRLTQPPLGTISALANSYLGGSLVRSKTGVECRNEMTSAFLVGGEVTTLWQTDAVQQFWGYDVNGSPILGQPWIQTFYDNSSPPKLLGAVNTEQMYLNATPVADIIGSVSYPTTTLELRLAQVNFESWSLFMRAHRPADADLIGITSPFLNLGVGGGAAMRPDLVNDKQKEAILLASNAVAGDLHAKQMRMYEFLKGYADEYMGKKFLVSLPFILAAVDPETLRVMTSYEVTDGGYLPEDSPPLGLSLLNQDQFRTQDGRFKAFAVFSPVTGVDLSRVSPQGAVVDGLSLYVEMNVDPRVVAAPLLPLPAVVVTINGGVTDQAVDNVGDLSLISLVLQKNSSEAKKFLKKAVVPIKMAPAARTPLAVAVPLKSNVLTYGPWFAAGAAGKVRFEQDPSLVPWNYGGYNVMNQAASARVLTAVTGMQLSEAGSIELAEAPRTSLGNLLQVGGPNVTNIEVQVGKDGVTTNYRFQTFTPRFGVFSRSYIERMKRLSLAGVELRRSLRAAIKDTINTLQAVENAARTASAWHARQAKAHKRETPHDVLHAYSELDANTGDLRTQVSAVTYEEAVVMANADDNTEWQATAIMGLSGLVRPFTAQYAGIPNAMPGFTYPTVAGVNGPSVLIPNSINLNPWKSKNDVEVYALGSEFNGLGAYRQNFNGFGARVMALRAPLILSGWGYDWTGNPTPGDGNGNWNANYMTRSDQWKVGPLDVMFDQQRGVWTCHDIVKGTMAGPFSNGKGVMNVATLNGQTWPLTIYTYFNSVAVKQNTKVMAAYVATDNLWYIVAADCP
jgi:hypothetical protein